MALVGSKSASKSLFKTCFVPLLRKGRRFSHHQLCNNYTTMPFTCLSVNDSIYTNLSSPVLLKTPFHQFRTTSSRTACARNYSTGNNSRPLRLMDIKEIVVPHVLKLWKSFIFKMILRSFDSMFTTQGFLNGAKQAVVSVSSLLSQGDFDALEGLVEKKAISEIKYHYELLTPEQRQFIAVNEKELGYQYLYEIGMIFDDATGKRFVEITVILYGVKQLERFQEVKYLSEEVQNMLKESCYICNYRFIREYTKGVQDDWTISELNHFKPAEQERKS